MKEFSELAFPAGLRYAKDHEWIDPAAPHRIGVSDFAQDQLGDLTFVELPEAGAAFGAGDRQTASATAMMMAAILFMAAFP